MTTEQPDPAPAIEADLESADAADAPEIAEVLADQLETELEGISNRSDGDG